MDSNADFLFLIDPFAAEKLAQTAVAEAIQERLDSNLPIVVMGANGRPKFVSAKKYQRQQVR